MIFYRSSSQGPFSKTLQLDLFLLINFIGFDINELSILLGEGNSVFPEIFKIQSFIGRVVSYVR